MDETIFAVKEQCRSLLLPIVLTTLALLLSSCGGAKVDNDTANADVLAGMGGTPDLGSALLSLSLIHI